MSRAYDGFHKIDIIRAKIKGKVVRREKLIMPNAVAGLVINEANKMALVVQYRPAVGHDTYEVPAGIVDKNLSNTDILHEELYEECGIEKADIVYTSPKPIDKFYMYPGASDGTLELYLVRVKNQLKDTVIVPDADVEMTKWFTLKQMEKLNENGDIRDPKTLIALNHFREMMTTPVTEKQQKVIDIIAQTTGKVFRGRTLEEARSFIAENIDESKRAARSGFSPGTPFNPAHAQSYAILSQIEAMHRAAGFSGKFIEEKRRDTPDIDVDFLKLDALSLDANDLMRRAVENMEQRTCDNCGEVRYNDHYYLCQSCYDSFPSELGDVTGEPRNNGHYGMPDQGDVGEGVSFDENTKFVGGGLDFEDEEDPDVGF